MKIKSIVKPVAVLGAFAVLMSAAGCADTSWSYKTKDKTLSNGTWIYYTYSATNEAIQKYGEENKDDDGNSKTIKVSDSKFYDYKVEGKKMADWIKNKAKQRCLEALTVDKLLKENKVEYDKKPIEDYRKQYISYMEKNGNDLFTTLGVSTGTIADCSVVYPQLSNELFKYFYGKGGPKEVTDEQLKKFYTDNYTDYYYIPYTFTTTGSDGNKTDIEDSEKDKVKSNFGKYAKELNEGKKKTTDIDEEYKKDFEKEKSDSVSDTADLSKSSLPEKLQEAIKALGSKKADVKEIDGVYYLIYKGDINEKAAKIKSTEDKDSSDSEQDTDAVSRETVLRAMKDDDYKSYLEEECKKLKYDTNDACLSKYTVERTVDIVKNEEAKQASA